MLLQCLAQHDVRLLDVVASLPPIHTVSSTVPCAWDSKGAVMRRLQNQVTNNVQMIDGIKLMLDEERWVLIRPDPDRPLFHVTAEAATDDEAEGLLAEYCRLVEELIGQRA